MRPPAKDSKILRARCHQAHAARRTRSGILTGAKGDWCEEARGSNEAEDKNKEEEDEPQEEKLKKVAGGTMRQWKKKRQRRRRKNK